jgi:hypothetical protein
MRSRAQTIAIILSKYKKRSGAQTRDAVALQSRSREEDHAARQARMNALIDVIDMPESPEEIAAALKAADAQPLTPQYGEPPIKGYYVVDDYVIEWDGESDDARYTEKDQWVNNLSSRELEEFYPDFEQQENDDFWESGGSVYHATPIDNVDAIKKDGIGMMNKSRGLSNRNTGAAVYTTSEPDEAHDGSYGASVFEINIAAMKTDYTKAKKALPFVNREPDIVEGELRSAIAHAIGAEDYTYDYEQGMSPNTFVINGPIPAKYLKLYNDESQSFEMKTRPLRKVLKKLKALAS